MKETGLAFVLIQLEAETMPSGGPTLIPDAFPVVLATLCLASKKTPQCWLNMKSNPPCTTTPSAG